MHHKQRVALLDLNNNVPNRGIGYLKRLLDSRAEHLSYDVFDVRHRLELPTTDYDIYISSGGPGSPFDFEGGWDKGYFELIERLWQHNAAGAGPKKYVFFICHSFQLACIHFKIGTVCPRKSKSFGTFPTYKTPEGATQPLFTALPDPFCIADFRDFQVIEPDPAHLAAQGFQVLALEKKRPYVPLPRALMAIRFSDTMIGTQFHPEADAEGMLAYFQEEERRAHIINEHGIERYEQMIADLNDETKITLTFETILPTFLDYSILKKTF